MQALAQCGALGLHGRRHHRDDFVPSRLDLRLGVGGEALLFGGPLVLRECRALRGSLGSSLALVLFAELLVVGFGERFEGVFDRRQPLLVGLLRGLPGGLLVRGGDLDVLAFGSGEDGLQRVKIALQDRDRICDCGSGRN